MEIRNERKRNKSNKKKTRNQVELIVICTHETNCECMDVCLCAHILLNFPHKNRKEAIDKT